MFAVALAAADPGALHTTGEGERLRVRAADGAALSTEEAFLELGLPEEAAAYAVAERRRKRAAAACWAVGSAATAATLFLQSWYMDDSSAPPGLGVVPAVIPVALGAGFVVRFSGKRHVLDFVDTETLDAAIEAHNLRN